MTRNDLILALIGGGYFTGAWALDDDVYSPVSVKFICDARAEWLRSLPLELVAIQDLGGGKTGLVPRWMAESGDCDNIARDFGVFLSRCMAVDAVKSGRAHGNVAAGKFNFSISDTVGHAINWFVDYESRAHCFDVASNQLDHLSNIQLATIFSGEST